MAPPFPPPAAAKRLREVLSESVPYCNGTFVGKPRDFLLYYGKSEQIGRIDLANATASELDKLAEACQPATFGLNQQDVLDETYRKAGKLGIDSFVIAFNVDGSGLIEVVRTGLFPDGESRAIEAEMYKLNVYGQGAFFKSHQDTPRAENMFGSLVIVFPTPHAGGALNVRHGEREWVFDSGKLLCEPGSPPSIAFAAFFGDVDHEVTPVISGHRVSVTYNLYFRTSNEPAAPTSPASASPSALRILNPIAGNTSEVANALRELLADSTFLPNGGTLGFGLRHQYPLPKTWSRGDPDPLTSLMAWLKGSDVSLLRACFEHGLHPVLRLMYDEEGYYNDPIRPTLFHEIPVMDVAEEGEWMDSMLLQYADATRVYRVDLFEVQKKKKKKGPTKRYVTEAEETAGRSIPDSPFFRPDGKPLKAATVHMLTEVTSVNQIKTTYATYGNEPSMDIMYMGICLVVDIGPAGQRDRVDIGRWETSRRKRGGSAA